MDQNFTIIRMDNGNYLQIESKEKILSVYSDFMMRITLFEELVSAGSRFLVGFQQALEVCTCHLGLKEVTNKAKVVADELESLLGVAASIVQTSKEKDEDITCYLDSCIASSDQDEVPSTAISRSEVADYGSTMAIVYSMVKQDYTMQDRIVSSLSYKSSQGELETYCQMWSLRPFVDDEIMRKAWNLVPNR